MITIISLSRNSIQYLSTVDMTRVKQMTYLAANNRTDSWEKCIWKVNRAKAFQKPAGVIMINEGERGPLEKGAILHEKGLFFFSLKNGKFS